MKAIILAAGKGKRFGEVTKSIPKPLIKFGKFCLIEHNIFLLKKYGFTDIVINVCHLKDKIINYLGDGKKYGISIQYSIDIDNLEDEVVRLLNKSFSELNKLSKTNIKDPLSLSNVFWPLDKDLYEKIAVICGKYAIC